MNIENELKSYSDIKVAKRNKSYLPGCMDDFLGLRMGKIREIAKKYTDTPLNILQEMLDSKYHEVKLCGLVILGNKVQNTIKKGQGDDLVDIRNFYMSNLNNINSWDLVDVSAYKIIGNILIHNASEIVKFSSLESFNDPKTGFITLDLLANSKNIWARRVSIISQFSFLWADNIKVPLSICQFHIKDHHHYIQKAVGWILREVGKRDKQALDKFLKKNIKQIGSISLSYSLEKHSKEERAALRGLR